MRQEFLVEVRRTETSSTYETVLAESEEEAVDLVANAFEIDADSSRSHTSDGRVFVDIGTAERTGNVARCYIGRLKILSGEYEFSQHLLFDTVRDPSVYLEEVAQTFYSPGVERAADGYYFHGGQVYVAVDSWKEISDEVYRALAGMVTEL